MATDYTTLDASILKELEDGGASFGHLRDSLGSFADKIAPTDPRGGKGGWRAIDRRLQVLRKAGKVVYRRGRWHLNTVKA